MCFKYVLIVVVKTVLISVCGEFAIKKDQRNIIDFVKKYIGYFGVKLGDQEKDWTLHKVFYFCVNDLRKWVEKVKISIRFAVLMVWRVKKPFKGLLFL